MASSAYRIVKTYLHKEKDQDIIQYIEDLPGCLRQKYLREALAYYRNHLENAGPPVTFARASEETAQSAEKGANVLKKVSLNSG